MTRTRQRRASGGAKPNARRTASGTRRGPTAISPWVGLLSQARAAARSYRWEDAARLCEQVIRVVPDQPEALEALGTAWLQLEQPARALPVLERARRGTPQSVRLLALYARAQRQSGALSGAIDSFQRALGLAPEQPELWLELGLCRVQARELVPAIQSFSRAIELLPQAAPPWHLLAQALAAAGKLGEAIAAERQALARNPWSVDAQLGEAELLERSGALGPAALGYFAASLLPAASAAALRRLERLAEQLASAPAEARALPLESLQQLDAARNDRGALLGLARQLCEQRRDASAVPCFEQALALGASVDACRELGEALWRLGQHDRAQQRLLQALALDPTDVAAYRSLGSWLASELRFAGDEARWQQLLAGCPEDVVALVNLGAAAQRMGRPSEAVVLQRRALGLRPDLIEPHINLAAALCDVGDVGPASAAHRRALAIDPTRWAVHSNLLLNAHFDPSLSPDALLEQHKVFGKALCEWVGPVATRFENSPSPARRLRIGYVSPDFSDHPVAFFLEPVLREHSRDDFEVYCYSDVARPDAVTARLRQHAAVYRACAEDDDAALAERIRADRIDILVDVAGHGLNNRMPVFARKPAPLQVSWLGYFDTTGLERIDYRIADTHAVPDGAERWLVERVLRLPRSATCFLPRQSPEPAAPPCLGRGYASFGCFSNPSKINRDVAAVFGRILRGMPHSRLLLEYHTFADPGIQARFRRWFAEEGIEGERILFSGHRPFEQYLQSFGEIDVALDPFPYSGETTALHALWMGVPLVALEGKTIAQRLASRVLRVAGLDDWVARSSDEYVRAARRLASDPAALVETRRSLRARLSASPLLDQRGVTRELEAAYRGIWQRWCAGVRGEARETSAGLGGLEAQAPAE